MKAGFSSFGLCAVLLAPLSALVHSFPTAENFAKLSRRGALKARDIRPEQLHESLLHLKEKRLLFDPMTTPIDGESVCHETSVCLLRADF
jgi:hypothetical protein